MVPIKRHKRRKLHPPATQLFICIIVESARVRTDHWNLEQLELEYTLDVEVHVLPFTKVVAKPVTGPFTGAGERRAADEERTFAGMEGLESEMGGFLFHHTP